MNLRWCSAAAAADAAARLGLEGPRYRDEQGAWWTVDAGRWETWRAGTWHPDQPPDRVEGPADDLPAPSAAPEAETSREADRQELAPAVAAAASHVAAAYRSGYLSSDAAEAALGQLYAVDAEGGVWTVGIRTGRWFRFHDGRWDQGASPPDPSTLVDGSALVDDSRAAVRSALAAFLTANDLLPEPVTAQWPEPESAPPAGARRATYLVPPSGVQAWESPNARARPFGSLVGGLEVQVLERSGAWARVIGPGGTECWVDGRLLIDLGV